MSSLFLSATEHAQICDKVGTGVQDINAAIAILREGCTATRPGDSIEMTYAPDVVRAFQEAVARVETDFNEAHEIACGWFDTFGDMISTNLVHQAALSEKSKAIEQQEASTQLELAAAVEQVRIVAERVLQDQEHHAQALQHINDAQRALDEKREEQERIRIASLALIWIPLVAVTLAVINATIEESAVQAAQDASNAVRAEAERDEQILKESKEKLELFRARVVQHEHTLGELRDELAGLAAVKHELELARTQLTLVQAHANECLHAVDGAWGSAKSMGNMLSLTNVAAAIHGLVKALSGDPTLLFVGELAELDEAGAREIDLKVSLVAKSALSI